MTSIQINLTDRMHNEGRLWFACPLEPNATHSLETKMEKKYYVFRYLPVPIFTSFFHSIHLLCSPLFSGSRYLTRLEFTARTPFQKRQSKSQMAKIKSFGPRSCSVVVFWVGHCTDLDDRVLLSFLFSYLGINIPLMRMKSGADDNVFAFLKLSVRKDGEQRIFFISDLLFKGLYCLKRRFRD